MPEAFPSLADKISAAVQTTIEGKAEVVRLLGAGWMMRGGAVGKGNPYIGGTLGQAAASAGRTQTFPGAQLRRLVRHMPKKKPRTPGAKSPEYVTRLAVPDLVKSGCFFRHVVPGKSLLQCSLITRVAVIGKSSQTTKAAYRVSVAGSAEAA